MDISSFVLLGQEQVLKRRMDIVANNMANMSTTGFKQERAVFHDEVAKAGDNQLRDAKTTHFTLDYPAVRDLAQGSFQATDNPLDVMIEGPGYLAVEGENGPAYTRAGNLTVNEQGNIAIADGKPVLGEGGATIVVPEDARATLTIAEDGTVSGNGEILGRIAITQFENESGLVPLSGGLYTGEGGVELGVEATRLLPGGLESSNVEPIVETTRMIDILRSYQSSMRMANSINDMRERAIDQLGKIG